jgi:hypothetical protein
LRYQPSPQTRRIEWSLSKNTGITIAVFIVGGRVGITMAGAITMPDVVIKKHRHHHYD